MHLRRYSRPLNLLLITSASIFIAEALVMAVIRYLPDMPYYAQAFLDAFLTMFILLPILYFSLFRPMLKYINAQYETGEALYRSKSELEKTVEGLRSSQEMLRASEEQYRLLFEDNPNPMCFYDPQTLRFLDVNHAIIKSYGYSREEFLSMTIKEIRPPEDIPALMDFFSKVSTPIRISGVWRHRKKDGTLIYADVTSHITTWNNRPARFVLAVDVTERVKADESLKKLNSELQASLDKVKMLRGLLPICAACKKIRDDKGYWNQVETYVAAHSEAEFSHGICPECAARLYPGFYKKTDNK